MLWIGDWALTTEITDLEMDDFLEKFEGILGGSLDNVPNDIEFTDITLNISPVGITLEGELSIDGYTTVDGVATIDETGIDINGSIENVTMDSVTIQEASINFFAPRPEIKSRKFGFAILGNVEFSGLQIEVSLYLETLADQSTKYTIYGEYDKEISTSNLAPALQGSFLDLPMKQVSFLAGNADSAASGFVNQFGYPIIKGE
jgi:hypothetical protein